MVLFSDVTSQLYAIGDLVDVREREQGSWVEGKIVRICHDPDTKTSHNLNPSYSGDNIQNNEFIQKLKTEDDENKPPIRTTNEDSIGLKSKSIGRFFTRLPKRRGKPDKDVVSEEINQCEEESLLFKVQLDAE